LHSPLLGGTSRRCLLALLRRLGVRDEAKSTNQQGRQSDHGEDAG
jgi:hypothetical protein